MKFKKGDSVKIVNSEDEKAVGQTGMIVDVDPDWYSPYEVNYDNDDLNKLRETGGIQDLFRDEDLELVLEVEANPNVADSEPTHKKVKELPTESKMLFIRDLKGDGDKNGVRNVSIIDLEKGVNRLNLRTSDVDDLIDFINMNKPNRIIFEIHDRKFKEMFMVYVNNYCRTFKIYDNGVVEYNG